jgi:hypothetical protein
MADLPHLPWPYRFGEVVEQDSPDELVAAAAVIVCTPRGHRDDDPDFGVTAPVFQQGALDLDRLAGEITQSDSRLSVGAEEVIDLAAATIRTVRVAIDQA